MKQNFWKMINKSNLREDYLEAVENLQRFSGPQKSKKISAETSGVL